MPSGLYDQAVTRIDDSEPIATSPCIVCGMARARPTFAIAGFDSRLVTCTGCGLGSLWPLPDPESIRDYYPDDYYGDDGSKFEPMVEALVRVVGARQASYLSRGLEANARVLDVGCGRGVVLRALIDSGYEAHGIDISPAATRGADPRATIRHAWSLADAAYPAEFFDRVSIWHVLEHLEDPRTTLTEIRRILRPGGRVVVAVPNFASLQARWAGPAWFHLDPPRHLYHFPLAALERLLGDCGFRSLDTHHFSLRQNPFGWVQSGLNRVAGLPRNGLYAILHRRAGSTAPFSRSTRFKLRLAYLLGMPFAVGLSAIAAAARSGATIHIEAEVR